MAFQKALTSMTSSMWHIAGWIHRLHWCARSFSTKIWMNIIFLPSGYNLIFVTQRDKPPFHNATMVAMFEGTYLPKNDLHKYLRNCYMTFQFFGLLSSNAFINIQWLAHFYIDYHGYKIKCLVILGHCQNYRFTKGLQNTNLN